MERDREIVREKKENDRWREMKRDKWREIERDRPEEDMKMHLIFSACTSDHDSCVHTPGSPAFPGGQDREGMAAAVRRERSVISLLWFGLRVGTSMAVVFQGLPGVITLTLKVQFEVILSNIDIGLSGHWECLVTSSRGNSTRSMEIVVLETSAPYCPAERVTNNKGDFRTLAGILAFLPCLPQPFSSPSHLSAAREKKAWRRCDRTGRWAEEDYTQCAYASQFTRVLYQISQMTINATNALTLAQQLSAFTSKAALFDDKMDIIFVTHVVEKLMRFVDRIQDLGDYISDIASNMMQVEEHVLWMAQNEARACTRIVQCVERIADLTLTSHTQVISKVPRPLPSLTVIKVSPNIALEAFMIKPSSFSGLSCTAVQQAPLTPEGDMAHIGGVVSVGATGEGETPVDSLLNFECSTANSSGPLAGTPGKQCREPALGPSESRLEQKEKMAELPSYWCTHPRSN
ncbi:hypothetical protein JZ751_011063 [Albula glossodonta]|uniref:ADGRA2/3 GAIN domain-containing protein n=1 Tax=Albula glossodonta TaxID=121402 RepID=A0A8T2NW83_9TELE|nr:hypothetical protein JZ751_011063 [Albula glossodonta]